MMSVKSEDNRIEIAVNKNISINITCSNKNSNSRSSRYRIFDKNSIFVQKPSPEKLQEKGPIGTFSIGFASASGKGIKISDVAINRSKSLFSEIEKCNNGIDPESLEKQPEVVANCCTNNDKTITDIKKISTIVEDSEEQPTKDTLPIEEIPFDSNTSDADKFPGFVTATGKTVKYSLDKARDIINNMNEYVDSFISDAVGKKNPKLAEKALSTSDDPEFNRYGN